MSQTVKHSQSADFATVPFECAFACYTWLIVGVHEPKYSSTQPSAEFITVLFNCAFLCCRWLIVGVHEPKYSSTQPSSEFATGAHLSSSIENELGKAILPNSPRTGYLGYQMITTLEPLFYQYGVDLVLTGHEHNYERSYPVYLDKVRLMSLCARICLSQPDMHYSCVTCLHELSCLCDLIMHKYDRSYPVYLDKVSLLSLQSQCCLSQSNMHCVCATCLHDLGMQNYERSYPVHLGTVCLLSLCLWCCMS